jgi:SWI/SNF-related matrix-associated actin-dependent regulator 1 of chromatin subfamily A
MINLEEIKGREIANRLKTYEGSNPYLKHLKNQYNKGELKLNEGHIEYIKNNFDREPVELNNVIGITPFLSEEYQKKYDLKTPITKVLVEYYLGDSEKAHHVIGKFYKNQEDSKTFWLPKTQISDDLFYKKAEVNVEFGKYEDMDKSKRKPYEYQKEGVKFLLERRKCVLADDMGLGKTYQTIVAAIESGCKKVLIICPASLKLNWKKELLNFVDEDEISVIKGSNWEPKKFTIINYDILKKFHTVIDKRKKYKEHEIAREIVDEGFDLFVLDEAHSIKNSTSGRSKIVIDIKKHIDPNNVWLLTGTPISNRPINYFNLLRLIDSPLGQNWQFYVTRYCNGKQIKLGKTNKKFWITTGNSHLDELNQRTRNFILRRTKDQHLDLPDKIRTPIFIELDNRKEYDKVYENYIEWRRKVGKSTNVARKLVELTLLRKFLALEKTKHTIELVNNMLEQDKKVIIFTNYREEMGIFQKEYGDSCVTIHGGTKMEDRQKNVESFQNDEKVKVFIGQIMAAGVGLTLTKAEVVVFNSLDWVPGNLEQAEDRAYRISQTKNVNVYYPLFDNTVDIIVWQVLNKKKQIINQIMDDNDSSFVDIFNLLDNEEKSGN